MPEGVFTKSKIREFCLVKDTNELYKRNPEFIRLCKKAELDLEQVLELDAQIIRESLTTNVVTAITRNSEYIKALWEKFDKSKLQLEYTWSEFCMLSINPNSKKLRELSLDERAALLQNLLRDYLTFLQEVGIEQVSISHHQLGNAVGIDHQMEVNRIVNKWLDEGKWLGLAEAGKPNPKSKKANVYKLIS